MRKYFIVTSGGTEEPIDSVRKITNMSTGKLGAKITNHLVKDIGKDDVIFYVCHKNSVKPKKHSRIIVKSCTDTDSVVETLLKLSLDFGDNVEGFIHSMAVSDYKVEGVYSGDVKIDNSSKIDSSKNSEETISIRLEKTPKIVDSLKSLFPKSKLVSFKLKDNISKDELVKIGRNQLKRTHSDLVVANDLKHIKQGKHQAYLISSNSNPTKIIGKKNIARSLSEYLTKL